MTWLPFVGTPFPPLEARSPGLAHSEAACPISTRLPHQFALHRPSTPALALPCRIQVSARCHCWVVNGVFATRIYRSGRRRAVPTAYLKSQTWQQSFTKTLTTKIWGARSLALFFLCLITFPFRVSVLCACIQLIQCFTSVRWNLDF